MTSQ
ncbi:hypothetical protein F383_37537 [Gossypium arboreum]|jgi:hypothetical protein